MPKSLTYWTSLSLLMAALGCNNNQDMPDAGVGDPGPSPLRRLTRIEYNNAIFQVFRDTTQPALAFVPEETALGYDNQAEALVVSPLLAEQFLTAAEMLAERHAPTLLAELDGCEGAAEFTGECQEEAESWVASFGKELFRRPLAAEEVEEWVTVLGDAAVLEGEFSALAGVEMVISGMLQSPHFLYRVEVGQGKPNENGIGELTPYEMATRLSFLFWNSPPDAILLKAAEADELQTAEQLEAQARRLLRAPRAREGVRNFHRQWLGLSKITTVLAGIGKDLELYPDYDPSLLPLWQEEAEAFFEYAIFEEDASVETLFTAPFTLVNQQLADFYGFSVPGASADKFVKFDLDPERFSGFLTQAGLLALYAKPIRSSPVHRGKFVRERLLCQPPPAPPDVVPEPPEIDLTKTTREQMEQHKVDPSCSGCHQMLDPLGLGFEHFDAIGRWRDKENGLEIDVSGEILETDDIDGPFNGVAELGEILASSEQVSDCVIEQWFRFAHGRAETDADEGSLKQIREAFAASEFRIQELLVALTQTDAFRYRRVPGAWKGEEK